MTRVIAAVFGVSTVFAAASCGAIVGFDDSFSLPVDAGAPSEASPSGVMEAGADASGAEVPRDAAPDSATDAAPEAAPATCPGGRGPAMVRVGPFCIDATEVTVAQYALFLQANPDTHSITSREGCDKLDKSDYAPDQWDPDGGALPVVNVDWCDAFMFCQWAGKHLCAAFDGGPLALPQQSDPTSEEWAYACSGPDGGNVFPYGSQQDDKRCNGPNATSTQPVPTPTRCEGSFAGVFDLAGNAIEWEDGCQPGENPQFGECALRGGSYRHGPDDCGMIVVAAIGDRFNDLGFRCCAE